jgi:Glycosyl hydrolase family 45
MNQRTFWVGGTMLTSALALFACDSGALNDTLGGAGSSAELPGIAGTNTVPNAGSGFVGSGGSSSGGGTPSLGGTSSIDGSGNAATGGNAPACTDDQHPDHMDKACSIWKEWDQGKGESDKNCNAAWLTGDGYCLRSCGKCSGSSPGGNTNGGSSPGSSGGTGSGTGGSNLGPGPSLPNISGGQVYWASRYWDCCKTHCAWHGSPSCGADGKSQNGGDSACNGGPAYACYNEAPRAVGTNVSYGYVAVPNPSCGACYHLQFTGTGQHNPNDPGSKALAGKHMIVKVTNTGGDVAGNQFDLMVPGGGVGLNPNTCKQQWNVSDLGPTSGGFLTGCSGSYEEKKACVRQKCSVIPEGDARNGCLWFVDWYQAADNPNFRYESITCPSDM